MKEKIALALIVLSLGVVLSACGNDKAGGTSNYSSYAENIPDGNSDGNYDNTSSNDKDVSDGSAKDKASSFISSEKDMIDSMVD